MSPLTRRQFLRIVQLTDLHYGPLVPLAVILRSSVQQELLRRLRDAKT